MPTVTFIAFCQRNTSEASRPGASTRHIVVNSLRKEHDKDDPNSALFDDEGGQISVQMNGVTAGVAAAMPTAKKIKVTLEVIE